MVLQAYNVAGKRLTTWLEWDNDEDDLERMERIVIDDLGLDDDMEADEYRIGFNDWIPAVVLRDGEPIAYFRRVKDAIPTGGTYYVVNRNREETHA